MNSQLLRVRHAKCGRALNGRLYIPWLWNTLLHDFDSLARLPIRHDCTAPSLPRSLRQNFDASREHALCSCAVPIWPCAKAEEVMAVNATVATKRAVRRIIGSNRADTNRNLQSPENSPICRT